MLRPLHCWNAIILYAVFLPRVQRTISALNRRSQLSLWQRKRLLRSSPPKVPRWRRQHPFRLPIPRYQQRQPSLAQCAQKSAKPGFRRWMVSPWSVSWLGNLSWGLPTMFPSRNPTGSVEGDFQVLRGGGSKSLPQELRVTARSSGKPHHYFDGQMGFRCAASVIIP